MKFIKLKTDEKRGNSEKISKKSFPAELLYFGFDKNDMKHNVFK